MKKLIFLLIFLLLACLASSCAPVTNDSEIVKQETLRQIEQAKERAEQKLTTQRRMEYARARQAELSEYAIARARQKLTEQELYDEEQEAEYKRFKEEWLEFMQSGDGSIKNKTTQEVKKLVDRWEDRWRIRMGIVQENTRKIFLEDFSLENFYKIFGKPWKTQYIKNAPVNKEYILWYTCKDGTVLITVGEVAYDDGWVMISDLNIL